MIVANYMTHNPIVIEPNCTVTEALDMMRKYNIRHLPVVSAEKLLGLLNDQDLRGAFHLSLYY